MTKKIAAQVNIISPYFEIIFFIYVTNTKKSTNKSKYLTLFLNHLFKKPTSKKNLKNDSIACDTTLRAGSENFLRVGESLAIQCTNLEQKYTEKREADKEPLF